MNNKIQTTIIFWDIVVGFKSTCGELVVFLLCIKIGPCFGVKYALFRATRVVFWEGESLMGHRLVGTVAGVFSWSFGTKRSERDVTDGF